MVDVSGVDDGCAVVEPPEQTHGDALAEHWRVKGSKVSPTGHGHWSQLGPAHL